MQKERVDLVQATLIHIRPKSKETAAAFYAKLFEWAPSTRSLFTGNMEQQGQKFMSTLSYAIHGLSRRGVITPVIEQLGRDHVGYGVLDEHYGAVKEALLFALGQTLGDDYAPEVEAAWAEAYDLLAELMRGAARSV